MRQICITKLTVTNAPDRLKKEVPKVKYCTNSEKGSVLRPNSLSMMQDKVNWVMDSEIASKNVTFINNVVVLFGCSGIPWPLFKAFHPIMTIFLT